MNFDQTNRWGADGNIVISDTTYGSRFRMGRHSHPELCISLIIQGEVAEAVSGRQERAGACWVGIKPPDTDHSDEFIGDRTRTLKLRIAPGYRDGLGDFSSAGRTWQWFRGGPIARAMLRTLSSFQSTDANDDTWIEERALDVIGALIGDERLALDGRSVPAWVMAAREEVIARANSGVQATAIAAIVGVHPVSLARAFRRSFGESISECVRRIRVERACSLLATTPESISRIAASAGFADQSHLTRCLNEELGTTPLAFRRFAASAPVMS